MAKTYTKKEARNVLRLHGSARLDNVGISLLALLISRSGSKDKNADLATLKANTSIPSMALALGVSDLTIQRRLKDLQAEELVRVNPQNGTNGQNTYTVRIAPMEGWESSAESRKQSYKRALEARRVMYQIKREIEQAKQQNVQQDYARIALGCLSTWFDVSVASNAATA